MISKGTFNRYVTLNLTFFRPSSPFVTSCNDHFRPLSYRNLTNLRYPLIKLDISDLQNLTKLGKKITFFADDTHLL